MQGLGVTKNETVKMKNTLRKIKDKVNHIRVKQG